MSQPEPRVAVAEILGAHKAGAPALTKLAQVLASDQADRFYTTECQGFPRAHYQNLIMGYRAVRLFDRVLDKLGPIYTECYVLDRVVLMLAIEVVSYCFDLKMMTMPIVGHGSNWQTALSLSNMAALGAAELSLDDIDGIVAWRKGFDMAENPGGWILQHAMHHLATGQA